MGFFDELKEDMNHTGAASGSSDKTGSKTTRQRSRRKKIASSKEKEIPKETVPAEEKKIEDSIDLDASALSDIEIHEAAESPVEPLQDLESLLGISPDSTTNQVQMAEPAKEPIQAFEPEPIIEPEPIAMEEPMVEPEPAAIEEPMAEPEPAAIEEPMAEPEPAAIEEPMAEPEPAAMGEPMVEPEPIAMSEPLQDLEPIPDLDSIPGPEAQAPPELESMAELEPKPETETMAMPEPVLSSIAEPDSMAVLEQLAAPEPMAVPEQLTELDSIMNSIAEPEPLSLSGEEPGPDILSLSEDSAEPGPVLLSEGLAEPELMPALEPEAEAILGIEDLPVSLDTEMPMEQSIADNPELTESLALDPTIINDMVKPVELEPEEVDRMLDEIMTPEIPETPELSGESAIYSQDETPDAESAGDDKVLIDITVKNQAEDSPGEGENKMDESIAQNLEGIGAEVPEGAGMVEVEEPLLPDFDEGPVSDETGVITDGMVVRGDIQTIGSLDVLGEVNGNLIVKGKLNISGAVNGNSKASEIFADSARIQGEVISTGAVKVGQESVIIGNISATSAVIAGAVKGDIDVHGPVILDTSAIVMGDIKSKSVQINNGAVIEGHCSQCYADISPTTFFDDLKKNFGKKAS